MTYQSEVLADSPGVYWRLGDASGTSATDSSGNGRHGTYVGSPTLGVAGAIAGNTAVQFDGVNDRVTLAATENLTSVSIEAWIKTTSLTAQQVAGRSDNVAATPYIFALNLTSAGLPRFQMYNSGIVLFTAAGTVAVTDGQWHHLVGLYSPSDVTARLYVDGVQVGTTVVTGGGNLNGTPDTPLTVGSRAGGDSFFNGTIDEVAYYPNAVLTPTRITAHYAARGSAPISGGQATETNIALAGVVLAGALILGGQATETDTALAGAVQQGQNVAGGQAQESDSALPGTVTVGTVIAGGQAQETDAALAGSIADTGVVLGGQALEVDIALPGTVVLGYGATDTTNRVGGRRRGGYAVATWDPPVVTLPAKWVYGHAVDTANALDPATITNGTQPVYTVDTASKRRHRTRIIVGGKDITHYRGIPTPLPAYQLVSPLLYGPATLRLPQVAAAFEHLGVGALKWLRKDAPVKIQRVDPDTGTVVATDYKGVVIAFDTSGRDLTVEIGGEASGRAAKMWQTAPIFRAVHDIGVYAYNAIRDLGLPFAPRLGPTTGINLARFGDTGMLDYISQLCARAWTRSGNQWTIMPGPEGVYRMARKDTTTIDATAYLDDARVVGDLRRDTAEEHNRIYATGVTPEGQRVRFGSYPGLRQGKAAPYPFHDGRNFGVGTTNGDTDTGDGIVVMVGRLQVVKKMPGTDAPGGFDADAAEAIRQVQDDAGLPVTGTMTPATWRALYDLDATGFSLRWSKIQPAAQKSYTRQWNLSGSGGIMGRNPDYDPRRLKSDRVIDLGAGLTIAQMREFARAEKDASEDNWVGTITFHTGGLVEGDHTPGDPIGASDLFRARRLKPGMNLSLPQFQGGIVVHVSAVSVDEDGKVSATVDTRARDSMNVWEVIARNKESRQDPARQWERQHRASGMTKDAIDGWDEVGGLLGDKVTVPGKTWTVFEVVAGQEGTISRLAVDTAPNAEYVVAVFGQSISPKRLAAQIGNPLTKRGAKNWADEGIRNRLDRDHLLLYVAGDKDQPCGYFPKNKRPETVITDETNPDYDPTADPDHVGTDDEPTIEVETETGSITPLTGRWRDNAGFGYRTFAQPVIYVAVYADRDTTIPAGRIMWPQLEAGA